jgi:hypothetical protein
MNKMMLSEAIKTIENEIVVNGGKEFKLRYAHECEISQNSFSYVMFQSKSIPMDQDVTFEKGVFTDDYHDKKDGVLIAYSYIPKRKRKPVSEHKTLLIA